MRWRNLNERAMQNVIKREMRTPRAKRKVGPEAKLLSDAVAMLRNIPKLFVMRVQVGGTRHTSANGKVRFAKSTMTGCADLLVWYRGAIRFDRAAESSIKHTEVNYRELPQIIAKMNDKAVILAEEINNMKRKQLSVEDMKKFAFEAARLRFDDLTNVNIEDILRVNRIEDEGNDVWTVFNRIQESLTHNVANFNQDILLNKQLFALADQYAIAV